MFDFDEVGKDIKGLAKVLGYIIFAGFVISAIACLIGGFATENGPMIILMLLLAVVILMIGYYVSRVSVMLLYGFGELIDNVMSINGRVEKLEKKGSPTSANSEPKPAPAAPAKMAANVNQSQPSGEKIPTGKGVEMEKQKETADKPASVKPEWVDEGTVTCPVCGRVQKADRKCCWDCGVKFDR